MPKKKILTLTALLLAALMTSCTAAKKTDAGSQTEPVSHFELSENGSERVTSPFREGCFAGKEYVIELVFTGNSAENSYSAILTRKDTGATVFTGTAFEISPDADYFTVSASNGTGAKLEVSKINKSGDVLKLGMIFDSREVPYISGKYEFVGDSYIPDNRINSDCLTPGSFFNENSVFLLEIIQSDGVMSFEITDKFKDEKVFKGSLTVGFSDNQIPPVRSAVLLNVLPGSAKSIPKSEENQTGGERVEFAKRIVNGNACIEVVGQSSGKNLSYSGLYSCKIPEYIDDGIYSNGDRSLKISTVTVRGTKPDEKNKYVQKIMLIDGKGDVVFTGTKELGEKQHLNCAEFSSGKGKLALYKGFSGDREFIEIMNFGYLSNQGLNERYELPAKSK